MPYDSAGNFSLVNGSIVTDGETVLPSQHNPPLQDIAAGLSQVMLRSGVAPMLGDLRMGGNRITDLAEPVGQNDAVRLADLAQRTSEMLYESDTATLSSSSFIDVTDIGADFREIIIQGEFTSISSNPSTVIFGVSVGSGSSWSALKTLVTWSNGGTTVRSFLANIGGLTGGAYSISFKSITSNAGELAGELMRPAEFAPRPISSLRFRIVPSSGNTILNIAKLKVTGIRA